MKALVHVTLKPSVLDPQGKAIHNSIESLGYKDISDIRQGKFFEITLDETADVESTRVEIARIAKDVLANPVIEDYRVEIIG